MGGTVNSRVPVKRLSRTLCIAVTAMVVCLGCGKRVTPSAELKFTEVDADLPAFVGSTLAWGDYDNDSNLDIVVSGWDVSFSPRVQVSENTGGVFTCKNVGLAGAAGNSSVAWADFDLDGYLDLAIAGTTGLGGLSQFYHNTGAKSFTQAGNLLPVCNCSVAWGDFDNDGDPDLAVAGEDYWTSACFTKILRNDAGTFTEVASLTGITLCSLAWGDYNNDGSLELLMAGATNATTYDPICRIVTYDGTGVFTEKDLGLAGVYYSRVAWGDYNCDGKLDIAIVGLDQNGDEVACVYRNLSSDVFSQIDIDNIGGILAWGDFDNNGYLDLVSIDITTLNPTIFVNNGSGGFYSSHTAITAMTGSCAFGCGDYDNDGDLDIATGGSYKTYLWRNDCSRANTPPNAPSNLNAVVSGSDVTLSWDPATDAETPSAGLTYNLKVRTDSGGNDDVMPCMSDPVTGKRRIPTMGNVQLNKSWTIKGLAPGTYHWTVQSVDNCYAGSYWAAEQTFVVP